jgi:hypothetical protein
MHHYHNAIAQSTGTQQYNKVVYWTTIMNHYHEAFALIIHMSHSIEAFV